MRGSKCSHKQDSNESFMSRFTITRHKTRDGPSCVESQSPRGGRRDAVVSLVYRLLCASLVCIMFSNVASLRHQDSSKVTSVVDSDVICSTPPPPSCYHLNHASPSTIVLSINCDIDEFYPELTLTQGDVRATLLGISSGESDHGYANVQHDPRHEHIVPPLTSYVFDSSGCGLVGEVTVGLKIYFHCVVDLYGDNPRVRSHNGTADARPFVNSPVEFKAGMISLIIKDAPARVRSAIGDEDRLIGARGLRQPIRPVAFDTANTRSTQSPVYDSPDRPWSFTPKTLAGPISSSNGTAVEYEWIHLIGDSVMRGMYQAWCALCPTIPIYPFRDFASGSDGAIDKETSTCLCNTTGMIVHYDQAWLDWTPLINRTGALMSDFSQPGSVGASVHKRALITFASLGSHTPGYSHKRLESVVPAFVQRFYNLTDGRLVLALTTAVCIEKIPPHHERSHGAWEMLLRNNYRLRMFNELTAREGAVLGVPVIDLFSLTLSAGCNVYTDAVHLNHPMQAALIEPVVKHFVPSSLMRGARAR